MVRHLLKILQQMMQDFKSVSDHFGTLRIEGLILHFLYKYLLQGSKFLKRLGGKDKHVK